MKKYNLYFLLTALLTGLFASCSQEDMDGPKTNEPTGVTLSASVDRSIQTRAVTMPNNYKLRYILEVWTTGDSPELKYRKEQLATDFSGVDFTFELTDAGNYNALLWADFVISDHTSSTTKQTISGIEYDHYADSHYKTTDNLKTITRTTLGNMPSQGNDAFCACHAINKTTEAYSDNVQLVRPFGQINIIEKNEEALAKVEQVKAVFNAPNGYNVETGMPTDETEATRYISFILWDPSKNDCTANLFYDYIFAPSRGQTTLSEIKLTFTSNDENLQIRDFTIPPSMPVVRNNRTNLSGHIVSVSDAPSNSDKLSVTISDDWSSNPIDKSID